MTPPVILQGVIQEWAPARLPDPVVLSISEPGDKVYMADARASRALGLTIDAGGLLPDALIVDIGALARHSGSSRLSPPTARSPRTGGGSYSAGRRTNASPQTPAGSCPRS